jgi:hypothetical protein
MAKESFPAGVRHEAAKGEGGRHLGIVSFSWCKLLGDDWVGCFFPIKLVDGIELISSIVLGSSAPCQTAAYWVTRRRLLWSSRASGCKTTICSGC